MMKFLTKIFEEAKHLPYIGVICSLGFLAHMSKVTLKTAHSVAARKMQKWSKNDFKMATACYCGVLVLRNVAAYGHVAIAPEFQ